MEHRTVELIVSVLGAISSTTSVILFLPQFWSIYRLRSEPSALLGVPVARMVILWVQALLWIFYGVELGQIWVSLPGLVNTPFMVASIVIVRRAHRELAERKGHVS
ncbi:PQ-loop domain-containing transporter [Brachybacterium tyrofermentans]|uniref:PQ-loop domain-containing transporter n=1 Tax=Brachybacterium tyrofermentans TaxID=47848 RepID=UPI003FD63712